MRVFEGKNYYQVLNLPLSADFTQIEQAYSEAVEMYGEDALATYALFTDEQRSNLLQVIEEAFQTLSNEEKRAEYNQMLISTGQAEAALFSCPPVKSKPARQENPISSEPVEHAESMENYTMEEKVRKLTEAIRDKGLVSGEDLKQLREAMGIDHSEIYQKTRISRTTLERIEQNQYEDLPADVFLKSFLTSYAEIIAVDPELIVDGYLKHRELWPGGKEFILNLQSDK